VIEGATALGLITARGGSKGLPGKNTKPLGGKPMILWTVEAAAGSRYLDRVVLSTDSDEIAAVCREAGCDVPFRRPDAVATDAATHMDVIRHALDSLDQHYDYLVLLQPTSPFLLADDIDAALELCIGQSAPACVSVTVVGEPPEWCYRQGPDKRLTPVVGDIDKRPTRRQGLPVTYTLNGALFIARCDWLVGKRDFLSSDTVAYEMPEERSAEIDTPMDFAWACFLIDQRQARQVGDP